MGQIKASELTMDNILNGCFKDEYARNINEFETVVCGSLKYTWN